MLAGQRILVTGAGGFVGTYLCAALAEGGAVLVGTHVAGDPGAGFAMDLPDRASVEAAVQHARPDVVVHLAGQASVGTALSDGGPGRGASTSPAR